jgi:hypothetical protein
MSLDNERLVVRSGKERSERGFGVIDDPSTARGRGATHMLKRNDSVRRKQVNAWNRRLGKMYGIDWSKKLS